MQTENSLPKHIRVMVSFGRLMFSAGKNLENWISVWWYFFEKNMSILTWWNILEDTKHSNHSSKNDEEQWAAPWYICLQAWFLRLIRRQIKQGIVIEEGKVWAALRHGLPVAGNPKVWMIMIPLLIENTATRVASGTCCSRIGLCRVSGGQPDQSYIFRFTSGRVNE